MTPVARKTGTFNSRSVFTDASKKSMSGGFNIWNGFFQYDLQSPGLVLFLPIVLRVFQECAAHDTGTRHQRRRVPCDCVRATITCILSSAYLTLLYFLTSYEDMPVLDWACTYLSKFSSSRRRIQIQDLDRLSPDDVKLLKAVLRGVRVTVSVPAGRRPARPIKDLVPNIGGYAFMKGDEETTIRVCSVMLIMLYL
jgi:hypothetical protein